MSEPDVWTVTTTTATRDEAIRLARALVEQRLAAGAEITGPATSVFWHHGEYGEGDEYRLTLKTSAALRDTVMGKLLELHPRHRTECPRRRVGRPAPGRGGRVTRH